jgi:type II secretory ATPase GspE/PulE/Tfp pilus assembly ATPase PilB-like protein
MPTVDARMLVEQLLDDAVRRRASDVHVEPTAGGVEVRFRVDGLLETVQHHDAGTGRSIVTRLMVMAQLLTYRLDVPQEGRATVKLPAVERELDLRLSVMPTTHGLRAAVRMPAELVQPHTLSQLGLPAGVLQGLEKFAQADAGMLILTGPAGSGKTTTIYALLQHIAASSQGLSIVALEDPVERDLPGVTQIQVEPFGELTYERTLRSILRQDPQVLMLGEIRDSATAAVAAEAALSGHRLLSTLHAATPAGAIARLMEMDVPPYVITSGLFGVVAQRLVRRRSSEGGYHGRLPVAEYVRMDPALARGVVTRADAAELRKIYASQPGYRPMRDVAGDLIAAGLTDEAEVQRALGDASA